MPFTAEITIYMAIPYSEQLLYMPYYVPSILAPRLTLEVENHIILVKNILPEGAGIESIET